MQNHNVAAQNNYGKAGRQTRLASPETRAGLSSEQALNNRQQIRQRPIGQHRKEVMPSKPKNETARRNTGGLFRF
ncbi:MAG: hypothetical protein H7330_00635 [Hymenobacteraceae bacterium]|nr:hypothetical protein [Hymenobacteraceae bacterium]